MNAETHRIVTLNQINSRCKIYRSMKSNLNFKICFSFVMFIAFLGIQSLKGSNWELYSPDKNIRLSITLEKNELHKAKLNYNVVRLKNGKLISVIESSPLGIIRKDQQFNENMSFVSKSEVKTIDERYKMKIGRQSEIRNNANELELTYKNENGALIQLVLRAYNDGVAFKYVFPEKSESNYTVTKELTGFKIPKNGKTWIERYDKPTMWSPGYEKYYENGIAIGTASPNVEGWAFPALFNSNGNWILLSEANLSSNYCGIRLEQNSPNGLYRVRFPDPRDAEGLGSVEPTSTLPWSLPWRTIIIGETIGTVYESQLINNVSDAAIHGDFSWVKTGRSSWSWLSDNPSPKNYNSLKDFIDFSSEMKWEYSLVDANWDLMQGGNIEQLIKYARTKGVGILMWYNSGGPNNTVTERPRDIMYNVEKRREEFKKLQEWGVKGIKIDFWHSDKQNLITYYHDVLIDAAQYHIMVNFHGCTIPRGWSRTYPNLISMEAVKGEECYLFDSTYTANAPVQNSILPFTRNVIGPMDYTPVGLSQFKIPHETTYVHELALTLIFNSGILHFCDNVKMYRSLPDYIKDFLKIVPVTFDETHYLSGYPGKDIVLASRKRNDWYIAGINSEKTNKEITFELPFISSGEYKMNLITDGANNKTFANKTNVFKSGDKVKLKIPAQGGFVGILKK